MKCTVYYCKEFPMSRAVPERVKKEDYVLITELWAPDLDTVFRAMNVVEGIELPIKLACRSMSSGDLVEESTGALLYCASEGWVPTRWA